MHEQSHDCKSRPQQDAHTNRDDENIAHTLPVHLVHLILLRVYQDNLSSRYCGRSYAKAQAVTFSFPGVNALFIEELAASRLLNNRALWRDETLSGILSSS